jgi:hypothetical protein
MNASLLRLQAPAHGSAGDVAAPFNDSGKLPEADH